MSRVLSVGLRGCAAERVAYRPQLITIPPAPLADQQMHSHLHPREQRERPVHGFGQETRGLFARRRDMCQKIIHSLPCFTTESTEVDSRLSCSCRDLRFRPLRRTQLRPCAFLSRSGRKTSLFALAQHNSLRADCSRFSQYTQIFDHRAQRLCDGPGLGRTPSRAVRGIGVENLRDLSQTGVL